MSEQVVYRTYTETIKRFFEPVRYMKKYAFQQVFKGVIAWSNPFIHVLFIHKIIQSIEVKNESVFLEWMLYYFLYVLIYELLDAFLYSW